MKKILLLIALVFISIIHNSYSADKHLLNEMITTVNRQYIEPVDNVKTITAGLQALHDLDRKFTVSHGTDRIYMYYNGKISGVVPMPKDDSISGWVNTVDKAIENAVQISKKASIKDFEIPDLIMKKIAQSLDEYSHYYSEYEYNENEEENAIFTLYADRVIDDILYIRVRIFNKQTGAMVEQSLNNHPNVKGVILDLRGNSGGMFNEALKVAKLFCDDEIITYTAGRNEQNKHYYTAGGKALYTGPLVVLIDGQTASAAEVLAAGLQEQSRAKLVGSHSFGKGTIQKITLMSNGGKLVLTTEQFFTPSGKVIHKKGIEPDICTDYDNNGKCVKSERRNNEEDIEKAIELLKNEA